MTAVPLDTPDYAYPRPIGSRQLVNTHPNLFTSGGIYQSPWFDVTAFTGLLMEFQNFGLATDFGDYNVSFRDVAASDIIGYTHHGTWRGDLQAAINVPVLGAQASVLFTGPQHNVTADLTVTGHTSGPGTDLCLASDVSAKMSLGALAAGAGATQVCTLIREGAAQLHIETNTQPGFVFVQAFDGNGIATIVGGYTVPAGTNDTRRVWIPPKPILLGVSNTGAAAGGYNAALTAERS